MRKPILASLVSLLVLIASLALPSLAAAAPPRGVVAATELQTTWFFAEGATAPPFDTWLLLFNPNPNPATATVTFFGNGVIATRSVSIGANARASLFVNQILPNAAFGMRVASTLPIAAERAMYFRQDGTAVVGIPEPGTTWLFAEGATAFPHHTWFLLLNPNDVAANVTLAFVREDGTSESRSIGIPPLSRASVFANQILPPAAFSTRITSDQPIVAERSMFRVDTGSGHAVTGTRAPALAWNFAEGSTASPFDTWYLLFNPNPTPIRLTGFFFSETGPGPQVDITIPANARRSIFVNAVQTNLQFGAAFFMANGAPFVAERSMFFRNGAHGTMGSPAPTAVASTWFFAEGSTALPFDEWILLTNPSPEAPASATLTFFLPDGSTSSRTVSVPSQGRTSVFLNAILPPTAVATRITSDRPIVAERSMYFAGGNGGHNTIGISQ